MADETPSDTRLRAVELTQVAHESQLQDHERVLRALERHLERLADGVAGVQRKLILGAALLILTSPDRVSDIAHFFSTQL